MILFDTEWRIESINRHTYTNTNTWLFADQKNKKKYFTILDERKLCQLRFVVERMKKFIFAFYFSSSKETALYAPLNDIDSIKLNCNCISFARFSNKCTRLLFRSSAFGFIFFIKLMHTATTTKSFELNCEIFYCTKFIRFVAYLSFIFLFSLCT